MTKRFKWMRSHSIPAVFLLIAVSLFLTSCLSIKMGCPGEETPDLADRNILMLEGYGDITECDRSTISLSTLGKEQPTLLDMIYSLKKAAVDEQISGVIMKFGDFNIGWAQAEDIREAIREYRRSGKPIYAFAKIYSNVDYYIAASCDKVYLMPQGLVMLTGVSATMTYLKKMLDDFGIKVEAVRIGKYKTALEMFTEDKMTEAQAEQISALIDSVYNKLLDGISSDRQIAREKVMEIFNSGPQSFSSGVVESGLVDAYMNLDEIIESFPKYEGETPNVVSHLLYKNLPAEDVGLNEGPQIAVIFANGAISQGKDSTNFFSGSQSLGSDTLVEYIRDARKNPEVRAIVLRVDSPGGDGLASEAILRELSTAKKIKPVVVSMGNVAASGGYYISALANKIIAQPQTITGSIGVLFATYNLQDLYTKIGVNRQTLKRGKFADLFADNRAATDEEKEIGRRIITDFYNRFIQLVAEGRNTSPEKIDEIGQGRVWSGEDAYKRGLVDELGGLMKAIDTAKSLANIPPKQDVRLLLFPKRRNFCEKIMNSDGSESVSIQGFEGFIAFLPEKLRSIFGYVENCLEGRNSPIMALMPYYIQLN